MDDTVAYTKEQIDECMDVVEEFMEETLNALDVADDFEVDLNFRDDVIAADLDGNRDDIALLIGKRGQTLDAVQYLANAVIVAQCETSIPVRIDAQGYRDRRATQLEQDADRAVAEAVRRRESVELEPMTAAERKVIHMHLKDHQHVETHSSGREPHRRVVISLLED